MLPHLAGFSLSGNYLGDGGLLLLADKLPELEKLGTFKECVHVYKSLCGAALKPGIYGQQPCTQGQGWLL